eukprot:TRINITY_DN3817_c0_g1_i4.p1 TRINITY_DN3817_c0_g1~~TRINITY_DN3817_c0_g1_i4.p1  ORF type:complete len:103 (+),score=13.66 TRINITY_DN3817_c0_g1_i4:244-552(+)
MKSLEYLIISCDNPATMSCFFKDRFVCHAIEHRTNTHDFLLTMPGHLPLKACSVETSSNIETAAQVEFIISGFTGLPKSTCGRVSYKVKDVVTSPSPESKGE